MTKVLLTILEVHACLSNCIFLKFSIPLAFDRLSIENPLPAEPTLLSLLDELKSVIDWQGLGLRLGIPEHQLEEIKVDHRGVVWECRSRMLSCWLKATANPSWEQVIAALGRMKEWNVAAKIKHKLEKISHCVGKERSVRQQSI